MKTIYLKATGAPLTVDAIDAKEILKHSAAFYSDAPPESNPVLTEGQPLEDPDANGDGKVTKAELQAALDAKGITWKPAMNKAELQALLDAAQ